MKLSSLAHRSLPVLALVALLTGLAHRAVVSGQPTLIVKPFLLEEVRALVTVDSQVLVYNPAERGESIRLTGLELRADGILIERRDLDLTLAGDPEYGQANALIERLPHDLAHRHDERRYFAEADAEPFAGPEAFQVLRDVRRRVVAFSDRYREQGGQPFAHVSFLVPLDQIFLPGDVSGRTVTLQVALSWVGPDGGRRTSLLERPLTWRGPAPGIPSSFQTGNSAASVHRGDLHVHTCHGEAAGACSPSSNCAAETLQVSGSYTLAQLKTQYQALGLDWFTATDHSYCINSDAEYNAITAEAAAATDASFICISDTEVSSDEEGPQSGSDPGDAICLWTTQANHMGAHGITSRIYGGDDSLFGFCDGFFTDALNGFKQNIATIRSQGGYPVANHPGMGTFTWESRQDTVGIEANGLHGVEIWNGASLTGQGGSVKDWVDWLLAGRLLYAYSGSDTHDQAFGFGSNHVLLEGAFTPAGLQAAIAAGSVYLSDGPALIIETDLGGLTIPMGAIHILPDPIPSTAVTARVYYDFGADTGTVSIFRGRVGDGAETQVLATGTLTGSGFVEYVDSLPTTDTSWYRAYAENSAASSAAYTNPVFFKKGAGTIFPYCTAKTSSIGCIPSLTWSGTPSMTSGSPFHITAAQVNSNQFGILVYAYAADFKPFMGGTLCLGFPLRRVIALPSGGVGNKNCTGVLTYDFNSWIAQGKDLGLAAGVTLFAQWWYRDSGDAFGAGLTDALQFTIQP